MLHKSVFLSLTGEGVLPNVSERSNYGLCLNMSDVCLQRPRFHLPNERMHADMCIMARCT